MALTFLPGSLVIESDSSILDLPVFHLALRDWEDSIEAAVYPITHSWKVLDLGNGASFYGLQLINGWQLRFPTPGNYQINGNLGGNVLPVAGVYVERKTSAAYVTTAIGGNGPTAQDIATAVWAALSRTLTQDSAPSAGTVAASVRAVLAEDFTRLEQAIEDHDQNPSHGQNQNNQPIKALSPIPRVVLPSSEPAPIVRQTTVITADGRNVVASNQEGRTVTVIQGNDPQDGRRVIVSP